MYYILLPIPVVAWSKAWVLGCTLAGIAGSNPARGHGCVLSRRGLCIGLIPRPEELCVWVWTRNPSIESPLAVVGLSRHMLLKLWQRGLVSDVSSSRSRNLLASRSRDKEAWWESGTGLWQWGNSTLRDTFGPKRDWLTLQVRHATAVRPDSPIHSSAADRKEKKNLQRSKNNPNHNQHTFLWMCLKSGH